MRLEETVLRPGEFAIYLDTNRSVDLGRLLTFLECFRWTSDDGIVPAYDLEIIDLQKKCIFARFGFKWRDGKGPDEGRFSGSREYWVEVGMAWSPPDVGFSG